MVNKRGRVFLIISSIFLVLSGWFYFGSPTNDKNPQIEVLIAAEENKWQLDRLKAGLEQAAKELDSEVIYTEVSRSEYRRQQEEVSTRTDDMYKGILYGGPVDRKLVEKNQEIVNLEAADFQHKMNEKEKIVSADYQRGATLGKYLSRQLSTTSQVVYWQDKSCADPEGRVAGLERHLKSKQQIDCVSGKVETLIQRLNSYSNGKNVSLVMDTPQQLTDYLESSKHDESKNYLRGYLLEFSDKILVAIDDGDILAAVFQDDYSRGYQSIYQLIDSDQKKKQKNLGDRVIDKQNLFSQDLEPLLFPYNE